MPELRRQLAWHRPFAGPLLRFGGWMTVTNVVGPLMMNMDRFLIGVVISVTAVAYYATPYEVVTKPLMVPIGLVKRDVSWVSVVSPSTEKAAMLYTRSVKYILLVLFPIVLLLVAPAKDGLTLWLGADFALHSTRVANSGFAFGVLSEQFGPGPDYPDTGNWPSRPHGQTGLLELPVYLAVLFWLVRARGIRKSMARSARALVDAIALFVMAARFLPASPKITTRAKGFYAAAAIALFVAVLPLGIVPKAAFLLVTIIGFGLFGGS